MVRTEEERLLAELPSNTRALETLETLESFLTQDAANSIYVDRAQDAGVSAPAKVGMPAVRREP
eukprot:scaffold146_cov265-Pinguiococcus_pyrenoidosus.AAC.20